MKIISSTVQQLTITGAERLDPIRVTMEDIGPGQGRITITCWDDAYVNYWGAMGDGHTMASFFAKASVSYLVGKLKTGIQEKICDREALDTGCRAKVLEMRREHDLDKDTARALWEDIDCADFDAHESVNADLFYDIFGDEWWHSLPQRENPPYTYLCRIVTVVKEALRQHIAEQVPA